MKNVKRIFLGLILIAIVFVACSKDQIVVNEINGNWTTIESTVDGNSDLVTGDTWTFNKCEVAQGACTGSYTVPTIFGTLITAFTYNIYEEGTKISIDFSSTYSDISNVSIVERTSSRIKVTYTDSNGYHVKVLAKK